MSKPVFEIEFITPEENKGRARAVLDSGSFYTIIRKDILPKGTKLVSYKKSREFGTAAKTGTIAVTGTTNLIIVINKRMIDVRAFVSPDLRSDLLIGAEAMQSWDITIRNENGKTTVHVGRDMRDPEITEVVSCSILKPAGSSTGM